MTERNDNAFDDDEFPFEDFEEEPAAESDPAPRRAKSGNRNFVVAMGALAAVFAIIVIILLLIAFVIVPRNRQARFEEAAVINAQNTANALESINLELTQTKEAFMRIVPTSTATFEPSVTPVIVLNTDTPVPSPTEDPETGVGAPVDDPGRTATVAALLTQAANGGTPVVSVTPDPDSPTPTALPESGFAEDVGLPGLFGAAAALIVVIFLVRRMRLSSSG